MESPVQRYRPRPALKARGRGASLGDDGGGGKRRRAEVDVGMGGGRGAAAAGDVGERTVDALRNMNAIHFWGTPSPRVVGLGQGLSEIYRLAGSLDLGPSRHGHSISRTTI